MRLPCRIRGLGWVGSLAVILGVILFIILAVIAPLAIAAESKPTTRPAASRRAELPSAVTSRPAEEDDGHSVESGKLPVISIEDLTLLVQTSRRAMRETLRGLPLRGAFYRPPALKGVEGQIRLAVRSVGMNAAEVLTPRMDVVDAAVAAGKDLGERVRADKAVQQRYFRLLDGAEACGLELELYGPREYLDIPFFIDGERWTTELLGAFDPAVEGIGVSYRGKTGRCPPSDVVVCNYTPDLALTAAEKGIGLTRDDKVHDGDQIRYFRFRAYHLWQEKDGAKPIRLVRGDELIPAFAVNAKSVDAAIERMGRYLHYRQNRNGWFAYEYAPAVDRYTDYDSATGQLRALRGLAAYARWTDGAGCAADAMKGIRAALQHLKPLSVDRGEEAAAWSKAPTGLVLSIPGRGEELATSAHLVSTLLDLGTRKEFHKELSGLVAGMMASQDANGQLEMMFDAGGERVGIPGDDLAAGLALGAIAEWSEGKRNRDIENLIRLAGGYYGKRLPLNEETLHATSSQPATSQPEDAGIASPGAAAVLARGFMASYPLTNSARETDLAFAVLDRFVRLQVTEANCPSPELHGAFNVRELGNVGIDSASCLLAVAEGLAMARRVGDQPRVNAYRSAIESGIRFVMQLEIRESGCFFVRSRQDTLGGVRKALWDNQLRADDCAEAMTALMKAREALYGAHAN